MRKYVVLFAFILLTSCAARRFSTGKIIHGPDWDAMQNSDKDFTVWVHNTAAEKDMMQRICEARKYVCIPEDGGRIIFIERTRK